MAYTLISMYLISMYFIGVYFISVYPMAHISPTCTL